MKGEPSFLKCLLRPEEAQAQLDFLAMDPGNRETTTLYEATQMARGQEPSGDAAVKVSAMEAAGYGVRKTADKILKGKSSGCTEREMGLY